VTAAGGLSRRQFIAASAGVVGAAATATGLGRYVWPLLAREDLIPGRAPDITLEPMAWTTSPDRLTFAAIGDNGSGGRQAMAVAGSMAETYETAPFGNVFLLGDISYYGKFADRYEDVFVRPMTPLLDAGVDFDLAIGNHDAALRHSEEGYDEIQAEIRLIDTPGRYYHRVYGPADVYFLDSSVPGLYGSESSQQLEWLDDTLAASTSQWRIVTMHHPPFSSGRHGSTPGEEDLLVPILERHQVDLVLAGHDHNYERTIPLGGITYVVSGGGCKTTPVGHSDFTAVAKRILQFLHVDIQGDRLVATCIQPELQVADRFELRAREGR
jgi:3',5'-cyclic AMP phosphodiesterase CpdA